MTIRKSLKCRQSVWSLPRGAGFVRGALAVAASIALLAGCGADGRSEAETARDKAIGERAAAAARADIEAYQRKLRAAAIGEASAATPRTVEEAVAMNAQPESSPSTPQSGMPDADRRPVLWQTARLGMTVDEVRAATPAAQPSNDREPLANRAKALLVIDHVDQFQQSFKARFFFESGQLTQVMLSLTPAPTRSEGRSAFDILRAALRARYGPETTASRADGPIGTVLHPVWLVGGTNVALFYAPLGSDDAVVNVVYQGRIGSESAKL